MLLAVDLQHYHSTNHSLKNHKIVARVQKYLLWTQVLSYNPIRHPLLMAHQYIPKTLHGFH